MPPSRSDGGLYGAPSHRSESGRWLWMGGLSENTSDPPDLNEWIESQRTRDGAGANGNLGAFTVHRHSGGAWVHFTRPSLARRALGSCLGIGYEVGGNESTLGCTLSGP